MTQTQHENLVTKLNREMIRARFINRPKRIVPLGVDLPDLEDLTPYLALQELSAASTLHVDRLADDHGKADEAMQLAGMICKSLVVQETRERVFSDTDMQVVSEMGLSVLFPIVKRIKEVSDLTDNSLDDALKNSKKTPDSDSRTSSQES